MYASQRSNNVVWLLAVECGAKHYACSGTQALIYRLIVDEQRDLQLNGQMTNTRGHVRGSGCPGSSLIHRVGRDFLLASHSRCSAMSKLVPVISQKSFAGSPDFSSRALNTWTRPLRIAVFPTQPNGQHSLPLSASDQSSRASARRDLRRCTIHQKSPVSHL
jgi:hypothetical protein